MKNKIKILIILLLCKTQFATANTETKDSSFNVNDVITAHIEQNIDNQSEYEYTINLFVQNIGFDTVSIRSSFLLDDHRSLSHILIYSCQHENDSLVCKYNWTSPEEKLESQVIEYFDRSFILLPKRTVSMEIPIRGDYEETEIFFKIQIAVLYREKVYFFKTETNRIFLTKLEKNSKEK